MSVPTKQKAIIDHIIIVFGELSKVLRSSENAAFWAHQKYRQQAKPYYDKHANNRSLQK